MFFKSQSDTSSTSTRRYNIYHLAFVAAVGGFLFGYDMSVIGAANLYLLEQFNLSAKGMGFATSSAVLGCIPGTLMAGWLCDAIGRKHTMILACFFLAVSALLTALAWDINIFNIFRIIGGMGVGLCSVCSPMYIVEVAPAEKRGAMGLMYQMAIVLGAGMAPLVSFFLVRIIPGDTVWRWMFASEMIAVLAFMLLLFPLPFSPRWLAEKGRWDEAMKVLTGIGGPGYAKRVMDEIKASLQLETGSFRQLFLPGIRNALVIGCLLGLFNHWTGWSVFANYIPLLLENAGLEDRSAAIIQYALVYLFMAGWTLLAIRLVDKLGRRPLWMAASLLMLVATAFAGLVFHFDMGGFMLLLLIILCTLPHGMALGPLPWLMISELFPNHIRARAVAFCTTFMWLILFTGRQVYPAIIDWSERTLGSPSGALWVFTGICLLSFLFGLKMLPETKGRSLEDIAGSW